MGVKYYKTCLLTLFAFLANMTSYAQNIGYGKVHLVAQSETVNNDIPITPAIISFVDILKSALKKELKGLKKKDEFYSDKRNDVLKSASLLTTHQFIEIVEIEALRPYDYEEAKLSLYYFLDCWEKKNFRTKKKDFCKGCWNKNIERERFFYNKFANVYE